MLVFYERHEVRVLLAPHDEDVLAAVTAGIRVFPWRQVATLDMEDDVLEPDAALPLSFAFFASSQSKYFTEFRALRCVLDRHYWRRLRCARPCAQTRSEIHQSAANANQETNKKRG